VIESDSTDWWRYASPARLIGAGGCFGSGGVSAPVDGGSGRMTSPTPRRRREYSRKREYGMTTWPTGTAGGSESLMVINECRPDARGRLSSIEQAG